MQGRETLGRRGFAPRPYGSFPCKIRQEKPKPPSRGARIPPLAAQVACAEHGAHPMLAARRGLADAQEEAGETPALARNRMRK